MRLCTDGCRGVRVEAGAVRPYDAGTDCNRCFLFATNAAFNAARGGDGNVLPVAPPAAVPGAVGVALPVLRGPCAHEGPVVEPCHSCGSELRHVRACLHPTADRDTCTRGVVGPAVQACAACPDYADPAAAPRPGDPAVGVVIGSFKWPELVSLQLRLIRATCGPVPVCVSADRPADVPALAAIAAAHPDVYLWPNAATVGHTGGDLAAYWKGAVWGAARGLAVVAKLSQRMLFTRPRWLQDGATDLLASGLPLGIRGCVGSPGFPLRTEAALLDVRAWSRPEVLAGVEPGEYWTRRPGGLSAEVVLQELVRDRLGGAYWPWGLVPERRDTQADVVVWHNSHSRADYDALAARFGVALPADFHVEGWERDREQGEYRYG